MKMLLLFNGKPKFKKEFPDDFFNWKDQDKGEYVFKEIYSKYPIIQEEFEGRWLKKTELYLNGMDFIITDNANEGQDGYDRFLHGKIN